MNLNLQMPRKQRGILQFLLPALPAIGGALLGGFGSRDQNQTQTETSTVNIPDFLRPVVGEGAHQVGNTLASLQTLLAAGMPVAPFQQNQLAGMQSAQNFATGADGTLPAVQQFLGNALQTGGIGSFLPQSVINSMTGIAGGGAGLPPQALAALQRQGSTIPGSAFQNLSQLQGGSAIPQQSISALNRILSPEFLQPDQGMVDAATRAVAPSILSTFGNAGVGATTGGLARTAIHQAASDAFANQGLERQRIQQQAASQLGNLGLTDVGQRGQLSGLLGNLGLAGGNQEISRALGLGNLFNQDIGNQLRAGGLLGQFGGQEQLARAQNQFAAAGALPGLGLLPSQTLLNLGGLQQQQLQRQLNAPLQAQQMLLGAASGIPGFASPFLGSTNVQNVQQRGDPISGALGGALLGHSLNQGGLFGNLFSGGGGGFTPNPALLSSGLDSRVLDPSFGVGFPFNSPVMSPQQLTAGTGQNFFSNPTERILFGEF